MDIQATKLDVIKKLMSVQKETLLEKINKLLDKEMIVAYTVDGKPLTKEAYNKRLAKAEKEIREGKVTSSQELRKEIKNW